MRLASDETAAANRLPQRECTPMITADSTTIRLPPVPRPLSGEDDYPPRPVKVKGVRSLESLIWWTPWTALKPTGEKGKDAWKALTDKALTQTKPLYRQSPYCVDQQVRSRGTRSVFPLIRLSIPDSMIERLP